MKQTKLFIGIILLFMVIGVAAVTTNVIINVTTSINKNPDDFLVYFSDVKVDGVQDLSLVKNEKSLAFVAEFSNFGDKKTIDYDIANSSNNLATTSTRTGKLVVELSKSYTGTEFKQGMMSDEYGIRPVITIRKDCFLSN